MAEDFTLKGKVVLDTTGLAKPTEETKGLTSEFTNLFGGLSTATLGMAAVAGSAVALATAINSLTSEAAEAYGEFRRLGWVIGVSAGEMAKWNQVAIYSGSSGSALATMLGKMSVNLSDTGANGEKTRKVFEDMGITIYDTDGKIRPLVDLFPEFINGMNDMSNASERNGAAMDVVGRGYKELAGYALLGGEGIKRVLNESNSLTQKQQDELSALRGEWKDLNRSVDEGKMALGAEFAPAVTEVISAIRTLMDLDDGEFFRTMALGIGIAVDAFNVLVRGITLAIIGLEYLDALSRGDFAGAATIKAHGEKYIADYTARDAASNSYGGKEAFAGQTYYSGTGPSNSGIGTQGSSSTVSQGNFGYSSNSKSASTSTGGFEYTEISGSPREIMGLFTPINGNTGNSKFSNDDPYAGMTPEEVGVQIQKDKVSNAAQALKEAQESPASPMNTQRIKELSAAYIAEQVALEKVNKEFDKLHQVGGTPMKDPFEGMKKSQIELLIQTDLVAKAEEELTKARGLANTPENIAKVRELSAEYQLQNNILKELTKTVRNLGEINTTTSSTNKDGKANFYLGDGLYSDNPYAGKGAAQKALDGASAWDPNMQMGTGTGANPGAFKDTLSIWEYANSNRDADSQSNPFLSQIRSLVDGVAPGLGAGASWMNTSESGNIENQIRALWEQYQAQKEGTKGFTQINYVQGDNAQQVANTIAEATSRAIARQVTS